MSDDKARRIKAINDLNEKYGHELLDSEKLQDILSNLKKEHAKHIKEVRPHLIL